MAVATSLATGFSDNTCFPAWRALAIILAWERIGSAIMTASISFLERRFSRSSDPFSLYLMTCWPVRDFHASAALVDDDSERDQTALSEARVPSFARAGRWAASISEND